jgi:hypothetical protein
MSERNISMARFLFVYRRGRDVGATISPEAMQQMLERWRVWIGEGLEKGWILDSGDALTQEGRVVRREMVVTDGPFVESKEIVGGYSVIQADNIEAAATLAHGCPALLSGGSVEVRPVAGFSIEK